MMLKDSLKNINAFIHLIKNQKPLFLKENRHEDLKKVSANFREKERMLTTIVTVIKNLSVAASKK
jgi:hypothetical protein